MNYDEKLFKEKANRKARKIWLIFAILLSANYGSDFSNGLYSTRYYLTFLALCWIPFIAGEILLRTRGWNTERYKLDLVVGYGIFYTYVICTTSSPIVAVQNFCHNFSLFLTQIFGKYFRNLIHETEGFLPSVFLTFKMIITLLFNVGYNDLFFDFYLFLRKGCNLFLKLIDSVTYLLTLFA